MTSDSRELYRAWDEAREEVDRIRAQYIVIADVQPGKPVPDPEGYLVPDGLIAIDAAREKEQEAWRAWRDSLGVKDFGVKD